MNFKCTSSANSGDKISGIINETQLRPAKHISYVISYNTTTPPCPFLQKNSCNRKTDGNHNGTIFKLDTFIHNDPFSNQSIIDILHFKPRIPMKETRTSHKIAFSAVQVQHVHLG